MGITCDLDILTNDKDFLLQIENYFNCEIKVLILSRQNCTLDNDVELLSDFDMEDKNFKARKQKASFGDNQTNAKPFNKPQQINIKLKTAYQQYYWKTKNLKTEKFNLKRS